MHILFMTGSQYKKNGIHIIITWQVLCNAYMYYPTLCDKGLRSVPDAYGLTCNIMCRLVEALEMYDNPHMDSYLSDEQDGDLGGGLGSHAFGGMGLGDDMANDEKALLGPTKRGKVVLLLS